MPTSTGDLRDALLTLAATAHSGTTVTAVTRADAATALGHSGRALAVLREAGISPAVGDLRERQVDALARESRALAEQAPVTNGRLTELAAACADSIVTHHRHSGISRRWALTVALLDVIDPLCDLVESGAAPGPVADRVSTIRRLTLHAEQTATLNHPSRAANTVLDQLIPGSVTDTRASAATRITTSIAELSYATRTAATSFNLAESLAVTFAAQNLTERATELAPAGTTHAGQRYQSDVAASDAWRSVRTALAPFTDGTRRVQPDTPPIVRAALDLHSALNDARRGDADAISAAAQHLPFVAADLHRRAERWGVTGGLLAYACDLPPREHMTAAAAAGHRPAGIVRADRVDLQPVTDALHNTRLLTTELAATLARPDSALVGGPFAHRNWAAHQATLAHESGTGAVAEARHQTALLLQPAPAPSGPSRGR